MSIFADLIDRPPVPDDRRTQDRYADSGDDGEVVLLTSPWPESIYAFAPMWWEEAPAEYASIVLDSIAAPAL
jgi:hypothetical protein